jgi:hypothetical protein
VPTGSFSVLAVSNLTSKIITSWSWITFWETSIYESPYITIPTLPENESLSNIIPRLKSVILWTATLELPSSFSGAGMKVISRSGSNSDGYLSWPITDWDNGSELLWTWNKNILTISNLQNWIEYKVIICTQDKKICTKKASVNVLSFAYSPNCAGGLDFGWDIWCVEQDASLVASWYSLVAYAPYDKLWDLNMYTYTWWTLSVASEWILNNVTDYSNVCDNWDKTNSFCEITLENNKKAKGVFIDNTTADWADFIKYEWINSLNLWNNFAIEMSVRTPTVNNSTRYLFQLGNYKLYISSSNFITLINVSPSFSWSFITNKLDWNFHKIIATKLWDNYNLLIDWENKWAFSTGALITVSEWLYIWTYYNSPNYVSQWNNIIDYVKIYKK